MPGALTDLPPACFAPATLVTHAQATIQRTKLRGAARRHGEEVARGDLNFREALHGSRGKERELDLGDFLWGKGRGRRYAGGRILRTVGFPSRTICSFVLPRLFIFFLARVVEVIQGVSHFRVNL